MIPTLLRPFPAVLASLILAACAAGPNPGSSSTEEKSPMSDLVVPIPIEKSFLDGKGLVADVPAEYDDSASADGGERERGGGLLVDERAQARLALDDAVRDVHLAADRGQPHDELPRQGGRARRVNGINSSASP